MNPANDEKQVEREQVEWVFGLTGGELGDEDWEVNIPEGDGKLRLSKRPYWYDGVPDYASEDFRRIHGRVGGDWYVGLYRTVCRLESGYVMEPAKVLIDAEDDSEWHLVKSYSSSGEAECPCRQQDGVDGVAKVEATIGADGEPSGPNCPLCEAGPGEEHGHIYLGDGCAELVYRQHGVEDRIVAKLVEDLGDTMDLGGLSDDTREEMMNRWAALVRDQLDEEGR